MIRDDSGAAKQRYLRPKLINYGAFSTITAAGSNGDAENASSMGMGMGLLMRKA